MYDITLAEESHKEEILALYRSQIGREFCPWSEEYPTMEEIDFDLSRNSLFVMKEEDGRIIGAVSIDDDEIVEELVCWSKDLAPGGELSRLCVAPSYQGQKLAGSLLQFGMDELKRRGFKSIHFLVNRHNIKALKAYDCFDFNVVGETYAYEQDMLCYEKEL
ncbi:MAG: GNAT family N-acetyltransferase [Lachnospiraceae bacterium]|nr:GNAT family N-acetyltransferase [Lachnospiraceae bacterium]